jgi:hypothetical protein
MVTGSFNRKRSATSLGLRSQNNLTTILQVGMISPLQCIPDISLKFSKGGGGAKSPEASGTLVMCTSTRNFRQRLP